MAVIEWNMIHEMVDITEDEPPKNDFNGQAHYTEKARVARTVISTSVGDKPLQVIPHAKTEKKVLDKLNTWCKEASTAIKINLLTSPMNIHYEACKDLPDYIAKLNTFFKRLFSMRFQAAE